MQCCALRWVRDLVVHRDLDHVSPVGLDQWLEQVSLYGTVQSLM